MPHQSPRLVIATTASATPMGAQRYEEETARRAAAALSSLGDTDWTFERSIARSMRSPLPGTRRYPFDLMNRLPANVRRVVGAMAYPRAVVHRMGLSLPPAPHEVVTVHDTVAWRFPDEGTPVNAAIDELQRADRIVCVSAHTAQDLAELTGRSDVDVVYPGVDSRFARALALTPASLAALGVGGRYVLHTGGASIRKNLDALAEAWSLVNDRIPDVTLVLCGPPHPRRTRLFAGLPRTVLPGRLPDDILPGLVAGAAAVVVPSLYEGFGLPVLEAMAAGTPVVAAKTSSLPEVAGGAAILVEPTGSAIASGLEHVLLGGPEVENLAEQGRSRASLFDWDSSTRRLAKIWAEVGEQIW